MGQAAAIQALTPSARRFRGPPGVLFDRPSFSACGAPPSWRLRERTVRVPAEDAEGRKRLAGTMLRAPMSLEKMSYDAATGTVI